MSIQGVNNIKDLLKKFEGKGGGGFASFFTALKGDGDSAVVRFVNKDANDLNIFIVHEVEVTNAEGNRVKKYVKCTEKDDCIFCRNGKYPQIKMFLFLVDEANELRLWERGKTFIPTILNFVERYGDLSSRDWEIVRNGKAKDPKTTYQLFPLDKAERELPEMPSVIGTWVLDLNKEDMEKAFRGELEVTTGKKKEDGESKGKSTSKTSRKPVKSDEDDEDDDMAF